MLRVGTGKKTYDESLVEIIDEYRDIHSDAPLGMRDIALWAVSTGRWKAQPKSHVRELTQHLSRAARKKKLIDPQGRTVRAMHAAKAPGNIDQNGNLVFEVVWDFINTMSQDHAEISFAQRREKLAEGCRALRADADSFKDNNPNAEGALIQTSFDFTFDVEPIEPRATDQIQKPR